MTTCLAWGFCQGQDAHMAPWPTQRNCRWGLEGTQSWLWAGPETSSPVCMVITEAATLLRHLARCTCDRSNPGQSRPPYIICSDTGNALFSPPLCSLWTTFQPRESGDRVPLTTVMYSAAPHRPPRTELPSATFSSWDFLDVVGSWGLLSASNPGPFVMCLLPCWFHPLAFILG